VAWVKRLMVKNVNIRALVEEFSLQYLLLLNEKYLA